MDINSAKKMPGKPGNLPPKQRATYLQKVRTHARALLSLLQDTQYDVHDRGRKLDLEDPHLPETLVQNLASWGDDETGHVVAYLVDEDGVYDAPWDYPDCYLADQLSDLITWTFNSDYFDRGMRSCAPIAHANAGNTRIIYFNCSLYERVRRSGGTIPFPVLATVANVALRLPPENCVDEDTVRKQVRRYEERRANRMRSGSRQSGENDATYANDDAPEGDPF
jgi:hypothetical protein